MSPKNFSGQFAVLEVAISNALFSATYRESASLHTKHTSENSAKFCACPTAAPSAAFWVGDELELPFEVDAKGGVRLTGGRRAGSLEQVILHSERHMETEAAEDCWGSPVGVGQPGQGKLSSTQEEALKYGSKPRLGLAAL